MDIALNTAVTIRYRFYDAQQPSQAKEKEDILLTYLHGVENILAGLKNALEGKQKGDKLSVALPPEQAFGLRQDEVAQRVPIKRLIRPPKRLRPGTIVRVTNGQQEREVTVVKVGKFNLDVDLNHPFAGITLQFDITVEDVREATEALRFCAYFRPQNE